MAGEMIPVVHEVTGDETNLPWESLEAWAERGWHPVDPDWRVRYGIDPPADLQPLVQQPGQPQPGQPVSSAAVIPPTTTGTTGTPQ